MHSDYIQTIIAYNAATHRQLWDCIMHLTDEQYMEEVPYSIGSVHNHMVHVMSTDGRWLSRVMDAPLPARLNAADFATREAVRAYWDEVQTRMLNTVQTLDDAGLQREVYYEITRANGYKTQTTSTVWQILAHIVNHGTDHRAQILRVLHDLGAPTIEQDLMLYLWTDSP